MFDLSVKQGLYLSIFLLTGCFSFRLLTSDSSTNMTDISGVSGSYIAFSPDSDHWAVANTQQVFVLNSTQIIRHISPLELDPNTLFWKKPDTLFSGLYRLNSPSDSPSLWFNLEKVISNQEVWQTAVRARLLAIEWSPEGTDRLMHVGYKPWGRGRGRLSPDDGPSAQLIFLDSENTMSVLANLYRDEGIPLAINEQYILHGGRELSIWNRRDEELSAYKPTIDGYVNHLCLIPGKPEVIWAYTDGRMVWFDLEKNQVLYSWEAYNDRLEALAIHPTQPLIATAAESQGWKLWHLSDTGPKLLQEDVHDRFINGLAFHPKEAVLYVSEEEPEDKIVMYPYERP